MASGCTHAYLQRRLAEGETRPEAYRCLNPTPRPLHERHFERDSDGFVYRLLVEYEPRGESSGLFDRFPLARRIRGAIPPTLVGLGAEFLHFRRLANRRTRGAASRDVRQPGPMRRGAIAWRRMQEYDPTRSRSEVDEREAPAGTQSNSHALLAIVEMSTGDPRSSSGKGSRLPARAESARPVEQALIETASAGEQTRVFTGATSGREADSVASSANPKESGHVGDGRGHSHRPFRIDVPEERLVELRRRIAAARWPSDELVADRSQAVQLATMRALTRYWATEHDWPGEAQRAAAFKTEIDGLDPHFNEADRGGHFAAREKPELFSQELRAAFSHCGDRGIGGADSQRQQEAHMSETVQQAPGIKRTDLQEHELSIPGRMVIQNRVQLGPEAPAVRHKHPGEEIIYVLEGSLEYAIDGSEPKTYHAGEALMVPAETVHAVRNVGSGEAAELATYVVEKDKPFLVVVE
jgi:quercetin dioxygenase-like cupin family protein